MLELTASSWVVNRQSMADFAALRSRSSAATSRRSSGSSLIRRFRHPLLKTLNSISPCSASCRAWECNETRGVGRCAELRRAQMLRRVSRALYARIKPQDAGFHRPSPEVPCPVALGVIIRPGAAARGGRTSPVKPGGLVETHYRPLRMVRLLRPAFAADLFGAPQGDYFRKCVCPSGAALHAIDQRP